jgi:hypothetical protein
MDGLNVIESAAAQADDRNADAIVRAQYVLRLERSDGGGARSQEISTIDIDGHNNS